MAHPTGAPSNLFQVLTDWTDILKRTSLGRGGSMAANQSEAEAEPKKVTKHHRERVSAQMRSARCKTKPTT